MLEEERCERLKANTNVHIQMYIKKMRSVDADLILLGEQGNCHHEEINTIQREQKKQKAFNCQMEEKMWMMEGV